MRGGSFLAFPFFIVMEQEIWKDIPNYEGLYQVSNFGNVKSLARFVKHGEREMFVKERILKTRKNKNGYLSVYPCKNGKYKPMDIHRIVGVVFIDNPCGYGDINHKDGNKENNHVGNLEWCSRSYNIKHAYDILGHKHIKHPIKCIETGIVYDGSVDAAKALGLNSSAIRNNARGVSKSTFGLHFIFVDKLKLL